MERSGNQLIPSSTGRWGERLSLGMNRALTASLAARLPGFVVTASPPRATGGQSWSKWLPSSRERTTRSFSLPAGPSLTAPLAKAHSTTGDLVEAIEGTGDNAVVAAMLHAIEDLADQLTTSMGTHRPMFFFLRTGTVLLVARSRRPRSACPCEDRTRGTNAPPDRRGARVDRARNRVPPSAA